MPRYFFVLSAVALSLITGNVRCDGYDSFPDPDKVARETSGQRLGFSPLPYRQAADKREEEEASLPCSTASTVLNADASTPADEENTPAPATNLRGELMVFGGHLFDLVGNVAYIGFKGALAAGKIGLGAGAFVGAGFARLCNERDIATAAFLASGSFVGSALGDTLDALWKMPGTFVSAGRVAHDLARGTAYVARQHALPAVRHAWAAWV